MMRKRFIIIGVTILFVGTAMLGWVLAEKRKQQQRTARYKLKHSAETNDYLKQYNEWLQLPPQERTQLPLVLDNADKTKTEAQLRQEQKERLNADMDKLAAGETVVYPLADILYGENWQEELDKHRKRQELHEYILTASIVCVSMGGSISGWCLLLWIGRIAVRGLSRARGSSAESSGNARQDTDEKPSGANEKTSEQREPSEPHSECQTQSKFVADAMQSHPTRFVYGPKPTRKMSLKEKISDRAEKVAVLVSDEKSGQSDISAKSKRIRLKALEESKPIDNTLEELTQQVSAIRQYTAFQQNRLEKLQDGYDWNIVRTFCLRVIRCIDNIENRISLLAEQDANTTNLEEVRDELIFALESSGIEQFKPKVNSDYRGQEKFAEAVKDKLSSKKPKQTGKIAKVIRPGYQYLINEGNVKVVRPAQVQLFA